MNGKDKSSSFYSYQVESIFNGHRSLQFPPAVNDRDKSSDRSKLIMAEQTGMCCEIEYYLLSLTPLFETDLLLST